MFLNPSSCSYYSTVLCIKVQTSVFKYVLTFSIKVQKSCPCIRHRPSSVCVHCGAKVNVNVVKFADGRRKAKLPAWQSTVYLRYSPLYKYATFDYGTAHHPFVQPLVYILHTCCSDARPLATWPHHDACHVGRAGRLRRENHKAIKITYV